MGSPQNSQIGGSSSTTLDTATTPSVLARLGVLA
jgi:hypothetical protein